MIRKYLRNSMPTTSYITKLQKDSRDKEIKGFI